MVEFKLYFKPRLWVIALGFLASSALSAQPKAIASLQPERIETGDTTGLLILISGLNTSPKEVDFSAWTPIFSASNIIGKSEWRRSGTQWMRRYTLIAFDSATLELPPLKVRVATGNPLETNGLTLTVFPTRAGREITDMAKIRDIRREPETWLDYWPWMLGGLAALLFLFWWLRRNRQKPAPKVVQSIPTPLVVSPTEMALQKLSALQQKQLWKQNQTKEHYAELSLILREYLETRYQIAALESTTDEIQKMLDLTDFPAEYRPDLKALLQKTDLVKYAQAQVETAIHEEVLTKARVLVTPPPLPKQSTPTTAPKNTGNTKPKTGKYEPL